MDSNQLSEKSSAVLTDVEMRRHHITRQADELRAILHASGAFDPASRPFVLISSLQRSALLALPHPGTAS